MDAKQLLAIIRELVADRDCGQPIAWTRDNFVGARCPFPASHIGTSGTVRCDEHLSYFTDRGEEFIALNGDPEYAANEE